MPAGFVFIRKEEEEEDKSVYLQGDSSFIEGTLA